MAHRGRLNVLAHVSGGRTRRSCASSRASARSRRSAQPRGRHRRREVPPRRRGDAHDAAGEVRVDSRLEPEHLEAVDPVVEGATRADQTDPRARRRARPDRALAVLIHGDAAFPAQGVVAETLNLQGLDGYSTGGTLHVIANNQVGFTTDPEEGRSTRYSSDLAKGFDSPIIHVNADDPRGRSRRSGWRWPTASASARRGGRPRRLPALRPQRAGRARVHAAAHGEGDRAASARPRASTPARCRAGNGAQEEAKALVGAVEAPLKQSHEGLKAGSGVGGPSSRRSAGPVDRGAPPTAVAGGRARGPERAAVDAPTASRSTRSSHRQLERRRETLGPRAASTGVKQRRSRSRASSSRASRSGWRDRTPSAGRSPIATSSSTTRTPGRPSRRCSIARREAAFEIYNSPLSEFAALGFEYGYSVAAPDGLVLWEAQFGDFVNNAQVVSTSSWSSGLSKWQQSSRLTLLLPHGTRQRTRALERAGGALPAARRAGQRPDRQLLDSGAVLPPAPPAGSRLDATGRQIGLDALRIDRGDVQSPTSSARTPAAPLLQDQDPVTGLTLS